MKRCIPLILISFCILLTGCSQKLWFSKDGFNKQDFYKDKSECQGFANIHQDSSTTTSYNMIGDTLYSNTYTSSSDKNELYLDCMRGKGYTISSKKPKKKSPDKYKSLKSKKKNRKDTYHNKCSQPIDCHFEYVCYKGRCITSEEWKKELE